MRFRDTVVMLKGFLKGTQLTISTKTLVRRAFVSMTFFETKNIWLIQVSS